MIELIEKFKKYPERVKIRKTLKMDPLRENRERKDASFVENGQLIIIRLSWACPMRSIK